MAQAAAHGATQTVWSLLSQATSIPAGPPLTADGVAVGCARRLPRGEAHQQRPLGAAEHVHVDLVARAGAGHQRVAAGKRHGIAGVVDVDIPHAAALGPTRAGDAHHVSGIGWSARREKALVSVRGSRYSGRVVGLHCRAGGERHVKPVAGEHGGLQLRHRSAADPVDLLASSTAPVVRFLTTNSWLEPEADRGERTGGGHEPDVVAVGADRRVVVDRARGRLAPRSGGVDLDQRSRGQVDAVDVGRGVLVAGEQYVRVRTEDDITPIGRDRMRVRLRIGDPVEWECTKPGRAVDQHRAAERHRTRCRSCDSQHENGSHSPATHG